MNRGSEKLFKKSMQRAWQIYADEVNAATKKFKATMERSWTKHSDGAPKISERKPE